MLHVIACLLRVWFPLFCLPLSTRRQHDLVDEVDDGGGGLLGVQLGKQVANVLGQAARLLGYETKHPEGLQGRDRGRWREERGRDDKLLSMTSKREVVMQNIVCHVRKYCVFVTAYRANYIERISVM